MHPAFLLVAILAAGPAAEDQPAPGYLREIRPILARHCYACHGPDSRTREAGLRLDRAESATSKLPSGARAIVPGNTSTSELLRRISSSNAEERMPPPLAGTALSEAEIGLLKNWIEAGASWEEHWAYRPPVRPPVPTPPAGWEIRNSIDAFVWSRLAAEGMQPSPPADPARLIRRAALALTGLPPEEFVVERFLRDPSAEAYDSAVDQFIESPRFGEHQAVEWLDAARYADTHGYHIDSYREMWRYRDWVIDSINRNQPFDEFTRDQIAGDMLPDATLDQQLATAFLRNHMINFEDGAIAEEYRHHYVADRTTTVATLWLGQTLRCAQCHDHKYDPWSQQDFYRFYALFNRVPERGLDGRAGNAEPTIAAPTAEQQRDGLHLAEGEMAARSRLSDLETAAVRERGIWESQLRESLGVRPAPPADSLLQIAVQEDSWQVVGGKADLAISGEVSTVPARGSQALLAAGKVYADAPLPIDSARNGSWTFSAWIFPTTAGNLGIASLRADRDSPRFGLALVGGRPRLTMWRPFETSEIWHATVSDPLPLNRWRHVCVVFSDDPSETGSVRFYVDGAESAHHVERFDGIDQNVEGEGKEPTEPDADAPLEQPVGLRLARVGEAGFRGMLGEIRLYARAVNEREAAGLAENDPLAVLLAIRPEERTADQQAALVRGYLHAFSEEYQRTTAELEQIEQSRAKLSRTIPTVMVMREGPPRPTFVLAGGDYRRPRDAVEAGLPAWLAPSAEKPFDRLALAHWLCAPENPLTARVVVNRVWQHYFGTGLVTTAEDFGTRGALPSHPELLDWLACEFRDSGWDRKHLHRLIVTSAVYRQASRVTADSIRRDPKNRLLARGPAVRLPAEVIRDSVLASGNLLHEKIGGPSVFPYQPPGLWREVSVSPEDYTAQVYLPGTGDQWYRRALYTFWKRTSPPPALTAFDAPNRESCIVARDRSNTPQQALVLWNDPAFVEAARGLAVYMLQLPEEGIDVRLARGFRRVLCRTPEPRELEILRELLVKEREYYEAHPSDARSLTAVGQSAPPENLPDIELAAYLNIATTLFSLDEFLCPR